MKSLFLRIPFYAAILCALLLSVTPCRRVRAQARAHSAYPLERLLNADGTLAALGHDTGAVDLGGWTMKLDAGGHPRFLRTSPYDPSSVESDTADVHWDDRFTGPSGMDGSVDAMAVMGRDIYFAGLFAGTDGIPAYNIVKWNEDSGEWASLGEGVSGRVYALAVIDTDLYVGGKFDYAGVTAAKNIARWNGAGWAPLGTSPDDGVDNTVYALAASGANLFVGGSFSTAGAGTTVHGIARWDGAHWSALGSGVNGSVYALSVSGSDLYAGGSFNEAGGSAARNIARWTGSTWATLGTSPNDGVNDAVYALAGGTPYLYVGGDFTSAGSAAPANYIARWNGSSWAPLGNGFTTKSVYAILIDGPSVYAGGSFIASGILAADGVARWDTASSAWSALNGGCNDLVRCMTESNGTLFVGGDFFTVANAATPIVANHVARWTGAAWSNLGTSVSNSVDGIVVRAMAISGADVYVGGLFESAAGIAANNIVRYNSTLNTWTPLGTGATNGVDGLVLAIALAPNGNVYVGGGFGHAGSGTAHNIARWDGNAWSALGTPPQDGVDSYVSAILVNGSNVFVGGDFTVAGGSVGASHIASWNGSSWSALGSGMDGEVLALEAVSSDLYAGGFFNNADGAPANHIARWNGTTWLPLGISPNDGVHGTGVNALAALGGALYVGGHFDSAGGSSMPANSVAKWDGSRWSPLGNGIAGTVLALAPDGSSLYAAGLFNATGILTAYGVAKWDTASGGSWSNLGSGVGQVGEGNLPFALAATGNDVYMGGNFMRAGDKPSFRFAHWNSGLVTTDATPQTPVPGTFSLDQNYPNPFNPATMISYSLPSGARVTLKVYDILGREAATLVDDVEPAGRHYVRFNASTLSSGVYFCRLRAGNSTATRKLLLLK